MSLAQIQIRRGTTAQWAARTSPLAAGEFGWDTTTGEIKVGNGTDLWDDLPIAFIAGDTATDTDLQAEITRATAAELLKIPLTQRAAANGVATLDSGTKIPAAQLPSATDTAVGGVELATTAEAVTGTDTVRAVTPAGVKAAIDALIAAAPGALNTLDELAAALGDDANFAATVTTALALKAPLASPTFTGTPAAPTASVGTNTTQVATTAFVAAQAPLLVLPGGRQSDNTRRAAYVPAITLDTNNSVSAAVWRYPIRLPVNTTRWRLHVANQNVRTGTLYTGGGTIYGVHVGPHALSGGVGTGDYSSAPVAALGQINLNSDGTDTTSGWVTATDAQWQAHTAQLLTVAWGCTASQVNVRCQGLSWYKTGSSGPTDLVLSGKVAATISIFDIWIEYEFAGSNKIVMFVGDSLQMALQATAPVFDSPGHCWQRRTGNIAVLNAYSGSDTADWSSSSNVKYSRFSGVDVDDVVIALGTNDIAAGTSAADTLTAVGVIAANCRTNYGANTRIHLATLLPRTDAGISAGEETARVAYNTLVRARPLGAASVLDLERAVRGSTITQLDADWNSGDNLHLNTAGYERVAQAITL